MAERLVALSDLKTAFSKFGDMSKLIDDMRAKVDEINKFNKDSAGNDEVGKQYHEAVDKPTEGMTDLMKQVRDVMDRAGAAGEETSDSFTKADEDGVDQANAL